MYTHAHINSKENYIRLKEQHIPVITLYQSFLKIDNKSFGVIYACFYIMHT